MPSNTCSKEFLELPRSQGGHEIWLLSTAAMKLRLSLRQNLRINPNKDLKKIWELTLSEDPQVDCVITKYEDKFHALKELKSGVVQHSLNHILGLKSQGKCLTAITAAYSNSVIKDWSTCLDYLPEILFRFVRKGFQQQPPTASNLCLWKKFLSDKFCLCGLRQTNKHVLSNCESVLPKYKSRHDHALNILAQWISNEIKPGCEFFADIPEYKSPSAIFISRRPDIVVKLANRITDFKHCELNNHSIEVTTLGFISDCSSFTCNIGIKLMPNSIKSALFRSVISDSYSIYCSRNSPLFT